jgi:hypothetical protein
MNAVVPMERQRAVEVYGDRSLTANDVQAQINLMQDVMRSTMIDGTHYGTIPGTKTKSLYKPGAEKLMATFRLAKWNGKVEQKQQVRTNPADVANTILKMAKKRGLVDAILTVTAASDIFTQDIEDLPDEVREEVAAEARAKARPGAQAVQKTVPEDSPEREKLIADMLAVADEGTQAFRDAWANLPKPKRALVSDKMEEFKAHAEAADKKSAEASES